MKNHGAIDDLLQNEFASVDAYLQAAHDILRDGYMPDMTGLDQRVADICAQLQQAEAAIGQKFLPKLVALIEKFDLCESEIRAFHDKQLESFKHAR